MTHRWVRQKFLVYICDREGCGLLRRFSLHPHRHYTTVAEYNSDNGKTWAESKKVPPCGGDK